MPFKSKKQQGYLYANKPKVAQKLAKHSKDAKMNKGYKTK
tara:strand:- start:657 stop:776 length:120 start_codon:yes stop_codon:yes gene_type:complete